MQEIYIRLDGVLGDVVSQYVKYYNIAMYGPGCPKAKPHTLYGTSQISPGRMAALNSIMCQPEPYQEMKLVEDTLAAIERFRDAGCEVTLFSDEIQKEIKQQWITQYVPNETQVLWINTNDLVEQIDENCVVVTTQFAKHDKKCNGEVVYYFGYTDRVHSQQFLWPNSFNSWSEIEV